MDARETPLARAFVRLADTLVADYDVIELCQQLVEDSVEILPASAAGLLLADHRENLQVLASTSEQTRLLELFQLQSDNGPCLDAYRTGSQVLVPDLAATGDRWPQFTVRVASSGFSAVYALPLRLRDERIGAMNLFCTESAPLTSADIAVGQALADVATIGILHQRIVARSELINQQLQTALNSRIVLEQARGVLSERGRIDIDQAFGMLRAYARNTNQRLADVARSVVDGSADTATILAPRRR